jgi:hypothetical protein
VGDVSAQQGAAISAMSFSLGRHPPGRTGRTHAPHRPGREHQELILRLVVLRRLDDAERREARVACVVVPESLLQTNGPPDLEEVFVSVPEDVDDSQGG